GGRVDGAEFFAQDDVLEVVVESAQGGFRGGVVEAKDQEVVDHAAGVVVAVKAGDDAHGVAGGFGDLIEAQIVRGNQLGAQEVFAVVFVPGFPIGAAGAVQEHQRDDAAFARLHEGQGLVTFVHR